MLAYKGEGDCGVDQGLGPFGRGNVSGNQFDVFECGFQLDHGIQDILGMPMGGVDHQNVGTLDDHVLDLIYLGIDVVLGILKVDLVAAFLEDLFHGRPRELSQSSRILACFFDIRGCRMPGRISRLSVFRNQRLKVFAGMEFGAPQ